MLILILVYSDFDKLCKHTAVVKKEAPPPKFANSNNDYLSKIHSY